MHRASPVRLSSVLCTSLALAWGVALSAQNPRLRGNVGSERFTMRVVATGLENPWEVTWGPDGALWVTERTGFRVTRVALARTLVVVHCHRQASDRIRIVSARKANRAERNQYAGRVTR